MENLMNPQDPQKTLRDAEARLAALHAEFATIHERRREVFETETAQRMEQAIRGGDVAGAASAALLDLDALDRREDELPELMWAEELGVKYASAAVERQEWERYEAREPEARKRMIAANKKLEEAEKEAALANGQYETIEKRIERHEHAFHTLTGEAEDFFAAGPKKGPLGGQASPMEGGGTSLRNLRRPR